MNPILLTAAGNPENQDRGLVIEDDSRFVLCVADGAGGLSGATEAAVLAVELVRQNSGALTAAKFCEDLLRKIDAAVVKDQVAGQTTCAVAVVTLKDIFGASVGDSGVWFIPESGPHTDLTAGQYRKPFIGSGNAWPVPFRFQMRKGWFLLATDGLLKYTSAERIIETCRQHAVDLAAPRLVELVRYSSGGLPDDVTIILTRL